MERSEGDMSLKNPVTPPGIDPGTVRLVSQRLKRYATPGPHGLLDLNILRPNTYIQEHHYKLYMEFIYRSFVTNVTKA
jgi:hypothetical protein